MPFPQYLRQKHKFTTQSLFSDEAHLESNSTSSAVLLFSGSWCIPSLSPPLSFACSQFLKDRPLPYCSSSTATAPRAAEQVLSTQYHRSTSTIAAPPPSPTLEECSVLPPLSTLVFSWLKRPGRWDRGRKDKAQGQAPSRKHIETNITDSSSPRTLNHLWRMGVEVGQEGVISELQACLRRVRVVPRTSATMPTLHRGLVTAPVCTHWAHGIHGYLDRMQRYHRCWALHSIYHLQA